MPYVMATNNGLVSSRRLFIRCRCTKQVFLVDTGADISVVPMNKSQKPQITSNYCLSAANGTAINTYGIQLLKIDVGLGRIFTHPFVIASINRPIIGADFLVKFNLIVDLRNKALIDGKTTFQVHGIEANVDTPTPKNYSVDNDFFHLLAEFPTLTTQPDFTKPITHSVVHVIRTTGQLPVNRSRRLNNEKLKIAKLEFDYMLKLGIIRPSSSKCIIATASCQEKRK